MINTSTYDFSTSATSNIKIISPQIPLSSLLTLKFKALAEDLRVLFKATFIHQIFLVLTSDTNQRREEVKVNGTRFNS